MSELHPLAVDELVIQKLSKVIGFRLDEVGDLISQKLQTLASGYIGVEIAASPVIAGFLRNRRASLGSPLVLRYVVGWSEGCSESGAMDVLSLDTSGTFVLSVDGRCKKPCAIRSCVTDINSSIG